MSARDGPTRRQLLHRGGLIALPWIVGNHSRLSADSTNRPRAEACIVLFLNGGMSHVDTFDPKPDQPAEVRGEFAAAPTRVPGLRFTNQVPLLGSQAHRLAVLRSVGFDGRLGNHSPACYFVLTGHEPEGEDAVLAPPRPTDQPSIGSAAALLRPTPASVPAYVMLPDVLIENAHTTPGVYAGWLGSRYEAFNIRGDPSKPDFAVSGLNRGPDLGDTRLGERQALLAQANSARPDLADSLAGQRLDSSQQRAFDLIASGRAPSAFDIAAEPVKVRDRYSHHPIGQSLLLARRLVEAGVRCVNVHWPNVGGGRNWDTHSNGFERLKTALLPPIDWGLSALLDDLDDRGLLGRTLVVVLTEFGRAPQIGRTFQNSGGPAGRDHWSNCFTLLLAGGGVQGGRAFGRSDAKGAYPTDNPLTPSDVTATVYHALGIDPGIVLKDFEGRTHRLCAGKPVRELFS